MAKAIKVRVTREMSPQFRAVCSGVVTGSVGKLLRHTSDVPEGTELVQFSAKSLGYSGSDPIRVYIPSDALERLA